MTTFQSLLQFIARFLMATIFIWSGVQKIFSWDNTVHFMEFHHMHMTKFLLFCAIFIEVVGGLCILVGWKLRIASYILALYLIPVTFIFHGFWAISEPMVKGMQLIQFLKNLAIIGGLIMFSLAPRGKFSVDKE